MEATREKEKMELKGKEGNGVSKLQYIGMTEVHVDMNEV